MIITKEVIDVLTPNHGRTSCSDENPCNGNYEIRDYKFQGVVIEKSWEHMPRCNRCFLLDHLGYDTDLMTDIKIVSDISLILKQPKIKVTVEEE